MNAEIRMVGSGEANDLTSRVGRISTSGIFDKLPTTCVIIPKTEVTFGMHMRFELLDQAEYKCN
jgi:hypothetical protein